MNPHPCVSAAAGRLVFLFCAAVLPPCAGQTVGEALDAPGLIWSAPPGTLVQNDVTHDGVDAVRLTRTGAAALSTTVTGPAVMELQVRTSTEQGSDWFEASVGGTLLHRLSGEQPWQKLLLDIPSGEQPVDFFYRKDATTAHGADSVWVDAVAVLPGAALSVEAAVDANFAGEVTLEPAAAEWFTLRSPLLAHEDADVLILRPSGAAAGAVAVRLPVTGPGFMQFHAYYSGSNPVVVQPTVPLRAVSSGSSGFSGPDEWRKFTYFQPLEAPLPAAEVVFTLPAGSTVRLDAVRWTPWQNTEPGEALETPSLPWQLNGGAAALADAGEAHDGEDAIVFYAGGGTLSLPVTGPAQLTWWSRNAPALLMDEWTVTPSLLQTESGGWSRQALFVPPGSHVVRWRTSGHASTPYDGHVRMDEATFAALPAVSPGEAADAPGLTWSVTGALAGFGGGVESVSGGDAIHATALPVLADDRVEATGSGAARMEFAWRGAQTFALDGADVLSVSTPATAWTRVSADLPAGAWSAQWRTRYAASITPALDDVRVEAAPGETLSAITECTGGVRVSYVRGNRQAGPVASWRGEPGRQLLMDGNPQIAFLTEGSGLLRLRLWLSDGHSISVPGGETMRGSGTWQDVEWQISGTAGQTALQLPGSTSSSTVMAVDRVSWTTGATVETVEALDVPGLTWSTSLTGPTDGWLGRAAPAPATNPGDGDALVVPALGPDASAKLVTTITGEGWLTWAHLIPANARLRVRVNGITAAEFSGTAGQWERGYAEILAGAPRVVEFDLHQAFSGAAGPGAINDIGLRPWADVDGSVAEAPPGWTMRTSPQRLFRRGVEVPESTEHPWFLETEAGGSLAVLEAIIPDPGWLTFDAKGCTFAVDGAVLHTIDPSFWRTISVSITGPGPHKLRWTTTSGQRAAVDRIAFQPVFSPALGEALDQPAWTWTAPVEWGTAVPADYANDGVDCAVFTGPAGTAAQLKAPWPGEGMLSWWWFGPRDTADAQLSFTGGGISRTAPVSSRWNFEMASLSAEAATDLVWATTASNRQGAQVRLDEVRFTPYSTLSLEEALDTPGRAWSTGTPAWVTVEDGVSAGDAADSALAPPVTGTMFMEAPVHLPAWLEFDEWSGEMFRTPSLEVAGGAMTWLPSISGPVVQRRALLQGSGPAVLRFSVTNSGSVFEPLRAARLDRVFIGEPVSLAEALDSKLAWSDEAPGTPVTGFQMRDAMEGGDAAILSGDPPRVPVVTLTGPGEFSFLWKSVKTNSALTSPAARLMLDGGEIRSLPPWSNGWQTVRQRIGAGQHVVRIQAEWGGYFVLMDDFRFAPGGTDEWAAALDLPSASAGGEDWEPAPVEGSAGGTAMRTLPGVSRAALALPLQGAGLLRFSWKLPLPEPPPEDVSLRLVLDGWTAWTATAAADWQSVSLPVARPGAHSLVWEWQDPAGTAQAAVDDVTLTPFGEVSVAEALDTPGRSWTVTNMDGVSMEDAGFTGGDAVRFFATAGDGELSTAITGPARISFRWYQDFEAVHGTLRFGVAGLFTYAPLQAGRWELLEADVPAGLHTVTWRGLSGSPGLQGGFIDDVQFTAVAAPSSAAEALDLAGITVTAGSGWHAVTRPSVRGDDALIGTSDGTNVSLTLPGAGWFEFTCTQVAEWQPGITFSDSTIAVLEQVWRQAGPAPGMHLIRYRLRLAGTGTRQLRIFRPGNSSAAFFMLDDCTWLPADPIPLAEALDSPGITWTSSGTIGWTGYPFLPGSLPQGNGIDPSHDVGLVRSGGSAANAVLTTTVEGPFSLAIRGVNGGRLNLTVDGRSWTDPSAGTYYFLLPGIHTVQLTPFGSVSGGGLSVDSVIIETDPPPPSLHGGFRAAAGIWLADSNSLEAELPGQEIKGTVAGPGTLQCLTRYTTTVRTAAGLSAALDAGVDSAAYHIEFPTAGPHEVTFVTSGTVRDLAWLPGIPVLTAACGLQTTTVFGPADVFTPLPGGGLRALASTTQPAMIAVERPGSFLATWWQQTPSGGNVTNPGFFGNPPSAGSGEAGMAPPPSGGMPWSARRQFRIPSAASFEWSLAGETMLRDIRLTPQNLGLEEALDLPAGVEATAAAAGTVTAFFDPAYPDADAVALRPGVTRALHLAAAGPGILAFTAAMQAGSPYFRIELDGLAPVEMQGGRCQLPLGPGPHTITLGSMPGTWIQWQVDEVTFLALPFDPVAALGGVKPLVIANGGDAALWPLVLSGGADPAMDGYLSFYTASPRPARFSFTHTGPLDAGVQFGTTSWSSQHQPGANALWTAGPATIWLKRTAGFPITDPEWVTGLRLEPVPAPAPDLATALDAPGLTFTSAAAVLPHAVASGAVTGGHAAAFAPGDQTRWLQTGVTGPGILRWRWRTLTPGDTNPSLTLTGAGPSQSYNRTAWKHAEAVLPAGNHYPRWSTALPNDPAHCAEIDSVEWFPQWTFAAWSSQNALALLPTPAARAADDSDGDGAAGLLEFVFGLDPGIPDAAVFAGSITGAEDERGLPALKIARGAGGVDYLELQFPRRLHSGLTFQMQGASTPGGPWQNTGILEVLRPLGADFELCRCRDSLPLDPAVRPVRFVRLLISQP